MRLCDRDIEAWLDEGRLAINPRPPVERINGATVDVRLGNKFRTFRGHTAPFIDLSGPKAEVSAALDQKHHQSRTGLHPRRRRSGGRRCASEKRGAPAADQSGLEAGLPP